MSGPNHLVLFIRRRAFWYVQPEQQHEVVGGIRESPQTKLWHWDMSFACVPSISAKDTVTYFILSGPAGDSSIGLVGATSTPFQTFPEQQLSRIITAPKWEMV